MPKINIAMDIGGTNIRVAKIKNLKIVDIKKIRTNTLDFHKSINNIVNLIDDFSKNDNINYIGIAAPGPANYSDGLFNNPPNLPGWKGKNIFQEIKKSIKFKKILMINDADAMALAHYDYFKLMDDMQFLTISTGIGASYIVNGKLFKGGAQQVLANAPTAWIKKGSDKYSDGALELYSSGSGIAFRAKEETSKTFMNYDKNDKYREVIDDGVEALANVLANISSIINPRTYVFDGSIARHNKWYIEEAINLAQSRTMNKITSWKYGELNDDAGILGVKLLLERKQDEEI